jgi:hypothetical protein
LTQINSDGSMERKAADKASLDGMPTSPPRMGLVDLEMTRSRFPKPKPPSSKKSTKGFANADI